ncbi:MAG: hypothetical protein IT379_03485 [Deltaproteobacteria bacterium]|nr:hypothetical protein [Deltaproteobacteria bacterium]
MPLPLWVVVAPFVWAPIIAACVGWGLARVGLVRRNRRVRVLGPLLCGPMIGGLALLLPPSPALADHALLVRLALAALCAVATTAAAFVALRRRPIPASASPAGAVRDDLVAALRDAGIAAVLCFGAIDILWGTVLLLADDTLVELAADPSDSGALFAAARHALAADEPAVARARASLAERAGSDPSEVARITADAWAADGECRRAWAAIDRGIRLTFEQHGELRLREGVVGPTLARRCPDRAGSTSR